MMGRQRGRVIIAWAWRQMIAFIAGANGAGAVAAFQQAEERYITSMPAVASFAAPC